MKINNHKENLDDRTLIATMMMQSFVSYKGEKDSLILHYTNELSEERQFKQIEHFCELSFKIADVILKKSNERSNRND
jgi:hypothetical protein